MTDMDMPLPEPYGRITTHTLRDQQFFYRWPEPPYLDNAKECIDVHTAEAVRAIVAAEVAKEREKMMPLIDEAILDAAGAALAGAGYDGDAIEKIAPRVLEMWRGFKSAAAIRAAAPPQCTAPPSEPQ